MHTHKFVHWMLIRVVGKENEVWLNDLELVDWTEEIFIESYGGHLDSGGTVAHNPTLSAAYVVI